MTAILQRFTQIRREEVAPVLASALSFFFILTALMVLRPAREALGMQRGIEAIRWPSAPLWVGADSSGGERVLAPSARGLHLSGAPGHLAFGSASAMLKRYQPVAEVGFVSERR